MANLRDLLYTNAVDVVSPTPVELLVFNTNKDTPENGGRCCLWTVPTGITWIQFQLWGGGGGGAGSCCCMMGRSGGNGSYTTKTVNAASGSTLAGCQYTLCAAGTTGTAPSQPGCGGYTTYATGFGLSNLCARGGVQGTSWCWGYCNCGTLGAMNPYQCCSTGGDFNMHGFEGGGLSSRYCYSNGKQWAPVAPMTVSGPFMGPGGCMNGGAFQTYFCGPVFPGGAGLTAQTYGQCYCGQMGAGGLISVYYG